jgi:hypothetical protein
MSRISKLSRLVLSMSLVAASLALTPHMRAQQGSTTVRVPFAFSAGDQRLDAGEYQISLRSDSLLVVFNVTTHQSRLLLASSMGVRDIQSNGRLVFHIYNGDGPYLSQIWMPGRSEFSQLIPTRRERQAMLVAKAASSPGNVVEALAIPIR